ncbi:hypothetical protein [Aureispira sp. CCB-QB1]|uniref:hypothetical protein n=1 Tax=Aureispira sp. CCB-QB1 TaxID=1313421 RepID=UPI0006984A85|nr:hypothetical protein [Aureispira sp. CCB-QB1]
MRLLLVLLFKLCIVSAVTSQEISKSNAIEIANKLFEVEILSEKGKQLLVKTIKGNNFQNTRFPESTSSKTVNKESIIKFLYQAFINDYYYRSGIIEQLRFFQENNLTNPRDLMLKADYQLPPDEYEAKFLEAQKEFERKSIELQKIFEEKMKNFKGYQIEEKIKDEENIIQEGMGFTMLPSRMIGSGLNTVKEFELIHEKRSVLGKTCIKTLNDFNEIGLINENVFQDVLKAIKNKEVFIEFFMVQKCTDRMHYYNQYETNKSRQIELLRSLKNIKLISDKDFEEINTSYRKWELKEKFEFLRYCKKAKTFNLEDYPNNPIKAFPLIFEEIKNIVPNFNYKNLTVTLTKEDDQYSYGLIEVKINISLEVNGKIYSKTSFYDFVNVIPNEEIQIDTSLKILHEIQSIVNKVLVDQDSKERLYFANKRGNYSAYNNKEFGLILMNEREYKAWGNLDPYFLSQENHDNSLNSKNIDEIIKDLLKMGLFKHLSNKEIIDSKEKIKTSAIERFQDLLIHFPKTIVYFDWETGNLENPYEELTKEFREASRGAFNPRNIIDEFEKSWGNTSTLFSFEFKGKKYEANLLMNRDWLDPEFMELIEKALVENKVDGRIYPCISDGQVGGYIFLSKKQYQKLNKKYPQFFEGVYSY